MFLYIHMKCIYNVFPTWGSLSWEIASTSLACQHVCGAFSWLLVDIGRLWLVSPLGRRSWTVYESWLSRSETMRQWAAFLEGFCCKLLSRVLPWHPSFMDCDPKAEINFFPSYIWPCCYQATEPRLGQYYMNIISEVRFPKSDIVNSYFMCFQNHTLCSLRGYFIFLLLCFEMGSYCVTLAGLELTL